MIEIKSAGFTASWLAGLLGSTPTVGIPYSDCKSAQAVGGAIRDPLDRYIRAIRSRWSPRSCGTEWHDGTRPRDIAGRRKASEGAVRYQKRQRPCALTQGLEFLGSPTWARTRDLRINSRPLDLPANRHECCAFRVLVSNISCLLRPSCARGRPSLKHWILEASGGSLHTRGRASQCDREGVGGLRQNWLEAPHGASLSTRRKAIARREGRVRRPRGRREPS